MHTCWLTLPPSSLTSATALLPMRIHFAAQDLNFFRKPGQWRCITICELLDTSSQGLRDAIQLGLYLIHKGSQPFIVYYERLYFVFAQCLVFSDYFSIKRFLRIFDLLAGFRLPFKQVEIRIQHCPL